MLDKNTIRWPFRLSIIVALCISSALAVGASPNVLRGMMRRQAAIEALGKRLPAVAARYGKSTQSLRRLFLQNNDLWVDQADSLFYACAFELPPQALLAQAMELPLAQAIAPLDQTFTLHSLAGASRIIYLDFDGHVTSGTVWNSSFNAGQDIVSAPYDFDGNQSSFTDSELTRIQNIWAAVAEDFVIYNVDVTTEDPGAASLRRDGASGDKYGIRMVISPTNSWYGSNASGVAYVGSFEYTSDTPAFVFSSLLGNGNEKYVSECVSHESGHALGLNHDGKTDGTEYYRGHGNWAPIMGSSYYKAVTQWSKGEYSLANNQEDDLAVMPGSGVQYMPDDHGPTNAAASTVVFGSGGIDATGIIENRTDIDVFAFLAAAGSISISINPAEPAPNLDIAADLQNSAGAIIASSDPPALPATINATLEDGTYYLHVRGVGTGDPTTGYSDYASIGQYFITATLTAPDVNSSVLLDDNFDDGDYAGWTIVDEGTNYAPSAWSAVSGTMIQNSNIYGGSTSPTQLPKPGTYAFYTAGLAWTDYQANLTIRSQDDDAIGVMFRYQDTENYYRFSWDRSRGYRRLVKKEAGVFTLLAEDTAAYNIGQTYQLNIQAQGASLTVFIDGASVFNVTDATLTSGTIALYTWGNEGSHFDDVIVVSPLGGNLPPTISSVISTPSAITDAQTSQLQVVAADPDSGPGPLTYYWLVQPSEGALDDPTIANPLYFPPDVTSTQTFTLTVDVSDGENTTTDTVAVTVSEYDPFILLDDNFNDGDYAAWTIVDEGTNYAPSAWSAVSGTMIQNSNIYAGSTSPAELTKLGTYALYAAGFAWTDYQANLTIRSQDNDAIGVMFRYQDTENYYRFSWDTSRGYRRLVKKEAGLFTLLAEDAAPYNVGQTYQLSIDAQGASLAVFIDGANVFNVTDAALPSGTIALYTWGNEGSCFDDVAVVSLLGGNLPPTVSSVISTPSAITDAQTSQLQVVAADPDSGPAPLTYYWLVQPSEGALDDPTIANPLYFPPDVTTTQTFTLTVDVSDGEDTTTDTVAVTVSDDNPLALLADNFNDGDYAAWTIVDEGTNYAPSAWSAVSQTMIQNSNIYAGSTSPAELTKLGTYAFYPAGFTWTDYQANLTIRSQDNDAIGVMFRYQDTENYYRFSWDRSRAYRRLVKKEAGVFTLLAEDAVTYNIGQTYQLTIQAQGESLTVYIDGESVFAVTDTALASGTIALYTWGNEGSHFDDVFVE